MTDKELLFQAANTFTKNIVKNLFGINSIGMDTLISYVTNNAYDKYGMYLEPFFDKNGNVNIDILEKAFTDIIKERGGYTIPLFDKHIKFTDKDVTEFVTIFKKLKSNNG